MAGPRLLASHLDEDNQHSRDHSSVSSEADSYRKDSLISETFDDDSKRKDSLSSSDDDDDPALYYDKHAEHLEFLSDRNRDVEAQTSPVRAHDAPAEYTVPLSTKMFFLGLYFLLNLGVTLGNKALLRQASLPWLLTFSHTATTSIGCALLLASGRLQLTKLSTRENLVLVAFSVLFTLNIAISNVSLAAVSVPFHQVMRSTCPVFTILIYRIVYNRSYSQATYLSMIPLILGVGLATFGSYYFTILGFALTFLGVLLAAVKTVVTNRLMTGSLKLSALEVLLRMSPLAAVQCLVYAFFSGELQTLYQSVVGAATSTESDPTVSTALIHFTWPLVLGILCNGIMAFGLNIVSFQTNKVAGALTMSVSGNVKQCITILLGIVLFDVRMNWLNGTGMLIALVGAAIYSKVELDRKNMKS